MSGGQRQLVAIARALAVEPAVLLLDEPLSALDLKLRQHMRAELRSIQKRTGVTFIYITHDQGEALTMSDRIAVMNAGRVEQVGTSDEIYSTPKTAFVASFVGEANQMSGRITGRDGALVKIETSLGSFIAQLGADMAAGDEAILFIRPEVMKMGTGDNRLQGRLVRRDLEGPFMNLFFDVAGQEIVLHQTNTGQMPSADMQALTFAPEAAIVLPKGGVAKTGTEIAAS